MCTHIWSWLYTTMHAPTHKHTDARNLASALRHRLDPSRALSVEWTWMQKTCESQWVRCLTYTAEEETEQLFSSTCIDDPNLSKEPPPPRGVFLFTMFPDQEPCVRGPPSKNLVQILRGGSSYTRLEGTGTRPNYLVNRDDQKNEGAFEEKIAQNREIIVEWIVGVVGAQGQLTQGPNVPISETKYKRSNTIFFVTSIALIIGRDWPPLVQPLVQSLIGSPGTLVQSEKWWMIPSALRFQHTQRVCRIP